MLVMVLGAMTNVESHIEPAKMLNVSHVVI